MTTKRFFVNGKPSGMLDHHGRYMIPVLNLLDECRRLKLPQRAQVVEEEQAIVITSRYAGTDTDYDAEQRLLYGARIRAKTTPDEVWIDLDIREPKVSARTGGVEPEKEPYLWVGVRKADAWVKDWGYQSDPIIVSIHEPDNNDGTLRAEVGTHCGPNRAPSTPRQWIPDTTGTSAYKYEPVIPAIPKVLMTPSGLCFTSTAWYGHTYTYLEGQGNSAIPDPWWIETDADSSHWCYEAPFDPLVEDQSIPNIAFQQYPDSEPPLRRRWDCTAWLDPGMVPIDTSDGHLANFLKIKEGMSNMGVVPTAIAGKYVVMIGITDGWCQSESWAAGYDNAIEVEIRVNRPPGQIRKRFLVNPLNFTSYAACAWTYGFEKPDWVSSWCEYEYGPNPRWKNWWQGAFLVDVILGTIEAVPYYMPTNGTFQKRLMSNWECTPSRRYQISFIGTSAPFSNAFLSYPALPQVFAPRALELSNLGYSWGPGPLTYPVSCPNWCNGGSLMNADLVQHLAYVESNSFTFGEIYLYWFDSNYLLSDPPQDHFGYTHQPAINVVDCMREYDAGARPYAPYYESQLNGPESAKLIAAAEARFTAMGVSPYNQSFYFDVPGWGTATMFTTRVDDDDGCGDNTDIFSTPQAAIELEIPPGE